MTKHLPPPMKMRVERGRLVPAGQYDAERLDSYRVGSTVNVRFTADRMRPLERKYRAILGKVVKECKTPWTNAEAAHQAIKLACGVVNYGKTHSGDFFQWPRSLVDLDDKEMEDFFELAMGVIQDVTGIDPETLKKETAHVAEEDHDPETGELLPSDTGDGSSPSSGTDDATATASSQEPDQPSSSLADGSTAESSGTTPPSQPAGSPSLFDVRFQEVELQHLKDFARKALDDASGDGVAEVREVAIERMSMNYRDAVESKEALLAIEAMQMPISAVVKRKRTREQAADFIARDILGCDAKELEGRKNG